MSENSNSRNNATNSNIPPDDPVTGDMETVAARYLDLWQDNLRHWTRDPDRVKKMDDQGPV